MKYIFLILLCNTLHAQSLTLDTTKFKTEFSNAFVFYDSVTNNAITVGQYYVTQKKWVITDTMRLIAIMAQAITNANIIEERYREIIEALYKVDNLQIAYLNGKATIKQINKQWQHIRFLEQNVFNIPQPKF